MKIKKFIIKNIEVLLSLSLILITMSLIIIVNPFYVNKYHTQYITEDLHKLLNSYEGLDILPFEKTETGETCLRSYDVGDNVITFGYGNTFPTEKAGIAYINNLTNSNYNEGDCILLTDLEKLQDEQIQHRVDDILALDKKYKANLNQQQFDAIFLLYYLNESTINNDEFFKMLADPDLTKDMYINYFVTEYSLFNQFDTYGKGWTLRINDSADIYFDKEYERDY